MKLRELEKAVRRILTDNPATRGSDDLLYVYYLDYIGFDTSRFTVRDFLLSYRKYKIPTVESVGRCRRKLQEKNESLKPTKDIELKRRELEKSFYDYAIGSLGLSF